MPVLHSQLSIWFVNMLEEGKWKGIRKIPWVASLVKERFLLSVRMLLGMKNARRKWQTYVCMYKLSTNSKLKVAEADCIGELVKVGQFFCDITSFLGQDRNFGAKCFPISCSFFFLTLSIPYFFFMKRYGCCRSSQKICEDLW